MSETRIVDIIEFLDKSSRVINLKIRLRMTALQFGIRYSPNRPDALQNRGRLNNRLRILIVTHKKAVFYLLVRHNQARVLPLLRNVTL